MKRPRTSDGHGDAGAATPTCRRTGASEYAQAVAFRLTLGILAVTFVPLGVVFVVLGLVVDEPDRGRPEAFLYVGAPLALAGLAFTVAFILPWRREAARRLSRRQGVRTKAEVVRADVNWRVRLNGRPALRLTVRFPAASTSDGTVSGTFLAGAGHDLAPGDWIDIIYEPADPSNFEPVGS
jgi:hypothetical protein